MTMSNPTTIAIICAAVLISMTQLSWAQFPADDRLQYLIPHNAARLQTMTSEPPLIWNETVAEFARSYAQQRAADCKLQHSHNPLYGENIAVGTRDVSPTKAVEMWIGEKLNYDVGANNCKGMCGHYTQAVWKGTRSIGCAKARCQNGGTFITCNYYPPGNVIGQRPF